MRAWEFITEGKKVPNPPEHHHGPLTGLHRFADSTYDRYYLLNRVMMAAASTDGKTKPDLDSDSWASRYNISHPYTQADQDKLKMAYKAAGVKKFDDMTNGDISSKEVQGANTASPVKPFKGYKK